MELNKNNTFLINLDRRPDKLEESAKQLTQVGLEFTRIAAIDGKDLPSNELTGPQQGCFLSHKMAWQRIIQDGLSYALIFEDDICFSDDFNKRFSCILNRLENMNWEHFHLGPVTYDHFISPIDDLIAKIVGSFWGAHGYLLTNKGAHILVSNSQIIPVDFFICWRMYEAGHLNEQMTQTHPQRILIYPSCVALIKKSLHFWRLIGPHGSRTRFHETSY